MNRNDSPIVVTRTLLQIFDNLHYPVAMKNPIASTVVVSSESMGSIDTAVPFDTCLDMYPTPLILILLLATASQND